MLPKKEARTEPSSLSKTHIPHERTLKDTAHAGPQSAGHCNGGPNRCMKLLPPPAMSTLWSQFERWRWGSTARTPWVNSLQQEDGSHCMMGTRFWEELPESKVENGNNNRKIHSAYLTVLYQETKVVTLQSCIKPVIRMVRPMEVERGACRTGHPEQPAGVLGGCQGSLTWKRFSSPSGPKSITLSSPEQYPGPPRLPTWKPTWQRVVHPSASPPCPSVWHRAAEMIPTSPFYSQPHSIPHRGTLLMFETRACFALTSNSKVASSYIWNQNRSSFPCPRSRRLLAPTLPLQVFPYTFSFHHFTPVPLSVSPQILYTFFLLCNFSCIDSHTFSHPMLLAKMLLLVNVPIKSLLYFLLELTFLLYCASR